MDGMDAMQGTAANESGMQEGGRARYIDFPDATFSTVHDLGNLIQVASSGLNILSRDPYVSAAPALLDIVGGAKTALEMANAVVRDTIARADRNRFNIERVDVGSCLIDIQTIIGFGWSPGLQLEFLVAPDLLHVQCDRLSLQNAVLNLLFNARDAMPDGGLISIEATAVRIGRDEYVEVRVKDRGIGMSPETIVRAFEPFFTTKGSGLGGIGLPSVRSFAEDHGGKVEVRSALGLGTSVVLRLPAAPSTDRAPR